ncbi:DoxX family protein [Opitutia bacterium ISCC 51]|nr:DoxX family protein [Opitutae bacterium ISCC 51]QXD30138.1 DoxX family protein [Opitutae bacterium ISCC 52]
MQLPKLIYWFSTVLLSLLLLFSASMYIFNHADVVVAFKQLGYPSHIIYPLALAKILAVIAIVSNKVKFLKKLAYAGVFFNLLLAFMAHLVNGDGAGMLAFLGLFLLGTSFVFDKILKPKHRSAFEV